MAELSIKITNVEQASVFDPKLGSVNKIRVYYMVGPHGPFTALVDPAAASPEEVAKTVEQQAKAVQLIFKLTS